MQKNIVSYIVLIFAVLALCAGWMVYRYQTDVEVVPLYVKDDEGRRESVDYQNLESYSTEQLIRFSDTLEADYDEDLVAKYLSKDISEEEKTSVEENLRTDLIEGIQQNSIVKEFPINLGLDLKGGVHILLKALKPKNQKLDDKMIQGVIKVMENRLNPQGNREVFIQRQGERWINIEIPGERDPEKVERLIGETAKLEFIDSEGEYWEQGTEVPEDAEIILSGDDLAEATADFDQNGRPIIRFKFKKEAAEVFGKFTAQNIKKYLAISLDGRIISCPQIQTAIFGGQGIIEGDFTTEEVRDLSIKLNSGRLPVEVQIVEKHTVGPTLGAESIRKSLQAGLLGIFIVLIYMVVFYRLPGLVADLALFCYGIIMLGMLSIFNSTLTLPGIAGLILSIGMAVDANIIIFERLKEEIRIGKTFRAALDAGFSRAFTAILDANVTTLIATVVLYVFGTGPIRGFAVTLSLGILVSMFSAIIITRTFLSLFISRRGFQSYAFFGAQPENPELAAAHSRPER